MKNPNEKPKIALMSYTMDNRRTKGTALYTRKLIEGLLSDPKFDFSLIHYEKVFDHLYEKTTEIIMPHVSLPFGSHFVSQLLFFWKYRKEPFDIVHWFQPRLYPFYWLVPAKKIIVTVHGAGDITAPTHFVFSRSIFNFFLKHFHASIDAFIVVSENAKEEVVKHYGFSESKVKVIYNGGGENFETIPKERAKERVLKNYGILGSYILDVSRLQPHKNIVSLIKAYDIMRRNFLERFEKLVIVGSSVYENEDKKSIEHLTAKNSVFSKDIFFIPFVSSEDLNSIYSASDLFVFPSLDEGFGIPIIEAMASGVPVMTSDRTSMPEIAGDAATIVDPLNIDKLAGAMHNMLSNEILRVEMVQKGLSRAKEFTWSKMTEKTEQLYEEILK